MNLQLRSLLSSKPFQWAAVILCLVIAGVLRDRWWPRVNTWVDRLTTHTASEAEAGHDDHAAHAVHPEGPTLAFLDLSPEAMKNLGLTPDQLRPIGLSTFRKTISVPALIVERPGQTLVQVSTPMTGVVTEVGAIQGSSVEPGQLLFRMRLTHEDLVQTQTEFVQALGELAVEDREIKRLEAVTESGAISGKSLLERRYAKEKIEALIQAQREALRLHGLSARQVDQITKDRRLLSELSITVPSPDHKSEELRLTDGAGRQSIMQVSNPEAVENEKPVPGPDADVAPVPLTVETVQVHRGQSIEQGGMLCVLADYSQLYIEGSAFEQDITAIHKATTEAWKITALFPGGQRIEGLPLAFVASEVDPAARTLKFYVDLTNEILRESTNAAGQRFISWRFKPGQRLQLQVPVEEWPKQIVLPLDAVAQDGADSYVFQRKGKQRFDRIAVHVLHRDQTSVVIANDGSLFPGDVVALRNAHQIQMAIKNKSGGAIDPHAGHTH
jgi:membrane fusion protein, heavy metal efflux system